MIQSMIDAAKPGDTVRVPPEMYDVDVVNAPITLKSGVTLDLTEVMLRALPTDKKNSCVIKVYGVNDVTIIGGTIIGERDIHIGSTAWDQGGWGHGIDIREGSRNIKVRGANICRCFGDGVYISDAYNVEVSGVNSHHNRRMGLTIIHVDGCRIANCTFSNSGGTPPGNGIDLECDLPEQFIKNVVIERCRFFDNEGSSIGVNGHPGTYAHISIPPGNSFDMKTQPIWVAGGLNLGTPWWAFLLNRSLEWHPDYRWWGYRTEWSLA